jgi:hypothetical protein
VKALPELPRIFTLLKIKVVTVVRRKEVNAKRKWGKKENAVQYSKQNVRNITCKVTGIFG